MHAEALGLAKGNLPEDIISYATGVSVCALTLTHLNKRCAVGASKTLEDADKC